MADSYTIAGKQTTIGDGVHYVDGGGTHHAAFLKDISPPEQNGSGAFSADIHKFDRNDGSDSHMPDVPHSVAGYPNTWTHKPN